jgi:hypothetical protein
MEAAGRVVPATSARYGSCRRRARRPSTEHRVHVCHHVLRPWGQRALLSTAKCHHRVARHRLPLRYTTRAAGCCRAPPRIMEFRGRGHRVPPIATKCTPPLPTRSTASGTEWHRGLRATSSVNVCSEWCPVLQCYRAPPGAAVCCAASHANQRRSNADLRWSAARAQPADSEMRRNGHASQRRPPSATECH